MRNTVSAAPVLAPFKQFPSSESSHWYMGSLLTYLADSKSTNGAFSLVEGLLKPGNEPPPHVHTREEESFYILDGAIDAYIGRESFHLTTGEILFIPRHEPHTFIIRSPRARMLVLFTPGGFEGYFRSLSTPAPLLELPDPTDFPNYSSVNEADFELISRRSADYGVHLLSESETAERMPAYAKALRALRG